MLVSLIWWPLLESTQSARDLDHGGTQLLLARIIESLGSTHDVRTLEVGVGNGRITPDRDCFECCIAKLLPLIEPIDAFQELTSTHVYFCLCQNLLTSIILILTCYCLSRKAIFAYLLGNPAGNNSINTFTDLRSALCLSFHSLKSTLSPFCCH